MSKNKTILLAVCLLVACLASAVGVTYARYHSTIDAESINFTAASANSISVFGGALSKDNITGTWKELSEGWTQGDKIANWEFFVTNGKSSEEFAVRTQECTVELVTGIGSQDLTVELTYTTEDQSVVRVQSKATAIAKGSVLYSSYGDGYVHQFFDGEGNEIKFVLEGEKFSYKNLVLTVSEAEQPSLLDLRITGEYVNNSAG